MSQRFDTRARELFSAAAARGPLERSGFLDEACAGDTDLREFLAAMSGANGSITFDARGAIRQGIGGPVANSVYVFYVGNANGPEAGYRAVVLLPSGSTQIWSAPSGGPWRQVS